MISIKQRSGDKKHILMGFLFGLLFFSHTNLVSKHISYIFMGDRLDFLLHSVFLPIKDVLEKLSRQILLILFSFFKMFVKKGVKIKFFRFSL
jgi:hypothetical protein